MNMLERTRVEKECEIPVARSPSPRMIVLRAAIFASEKNTLIMPAAKPRNPGISLRDCISPIC